MRKPYIIDFQNIDSETGVLNIFEVQNQIDFDIKRVFILNDIKNDISRGNHAHKKTDQLFGEVARQVTKAKSSTSAPANKNSWFQ